MINIINRKKKLKILQFFLLILGFLVIFFSYYFDKNSKKENILVDRKTLKNKEINKNSEGNIFYNIEYSGLDLTGNRFVLKSKEALSKNNQPELVNLKGVNAIFYLKDNTILNVSSDFGKYNNKTLDIIFKGNVKAFYENSKLFADQADFSNSQNSLTIRDNVKLVDEKGTVIADKLSLDIESKNLNIKSFNENSINANLNLK